jgi:hypothetical protein
MDQAIGSHPVPFSPFGWKADNTNDGASPMGAGFSKDASKFYALEFNLRLLCYNFGTADET